MPDRPTSTGGRTVERLIIGAGGALLITSLFLPWAGAGGEDRSGFELLAIGDVFLLLAGAVALLAAVSGGRFGLFRPDMSVNGAADLLGVFGTLLVAWLVLFDFPAGAERELGAFVALFAAAAIAGGAGDYSTLRGAPVFPRLDRG